MFDNIALEASLPASDIDRAIKWYEDSLGLKPTEVDVMGGARYESGGVRFLLYPSAFAGNNQATAASFAVDDFDAAVAHLRDVGVVFEEFDSGEMKTVDGVLTTPDGNKGAWFKDSEGNILAIATM